MILNLLNARRLGADEYNILDDVSSNKTFIYMIMGVLCVHFTIIYYGGKYFKTAPLTLY
jgi:Ca2+ transporting ATPase